MKKNYAIVILAAGASTRMGQPKQLLPLNGVTLLERIIQTALATKVSQVVVVLGANAALIQPAIAALPVSIVHNANWSAGMSTSLQTGLAYLQALPVSVHAIVTLLCDQPYVSADLIHQLFTAFETTASPIVATTYGNTIGVPALFAASTFTDLTALSGQQGAKKVILKYQKKSQVIDFPQGALDLDTPEQYAEMRKRFEATNLSSHGRDALKASHP